MNDLSHGSDRRRPDNDIIAREAADFAVKEIVGDLVELGASPELAAAVRDAVRMGLRHETNEARLCLLRAGFDLEFASEFLNDLSTRMKADA